MRPQHRLASLHALLGPAIGLALGVGALLPAPAAAYVRTTTETGKPMFWDRTSILMSVCVGSPPTALTADVLTNAARESGKAWSHEQLSCSTLDLSVSVDPCRQADAAYDKINWVTFRREEWCREPHDASEPCYDRNALAITTVSARKSDGLILDADVEVNAKYFQWADLVGGGFQSGKEDIQNALTHEFGHVIGLDHTCYSGPSGQRPVDNRGQPAPLCSETINDPYITEATMYPSVMRGDTKRRTLSADDRQAVCDIYGETSSGCATGGSGGPRGAAGLALLGLATAFLLRRRGRKAA